MTQPTTVSLIERKFIIDRQGKDAVLYAGLLDLAHKQGLLHIAVTLLQAPSEANGHTAICHARAEFEGGKWFEDIGDANALSVGKMILPHIIRMAATRAKARTLRDALNINGAAVEEYGPEEDDDTPPAPRQQQRPPAAPPTARATTPEVPRHPQQAAPAGGSLATEPQIKAIKTLLGKLNRPVDWELLGSLTKAAASQQIQALQDALPGKAKGSADQTVEIDGYRDADVAF